MAFCRCRTHLRKAFLVYAINNLKHNTNGKKAFNFWGKTFAVALTAAVAGMVMVACSDDDEDIEATRTEILNFYYSKEDGERQMANGEVTNDADYIFNDEYMKNLANQKDVKEILLHNVGDWDCARSDGMNAWRRALEDAIAINPKKIRGNGTFELDFKPKNYDFIANDVNTWRRDSTWFVQNGWKFKQVSR